MIRNKSRRLIVATYPSTRGRREGLRVRLPRQENARSRHQRLFEENVGKTGKVWSTNFNCERFEVVFTRGEGINTPRIRHKGRQPLIKCADMTSICFIFPFYVFMSFYALFFYLFVVNKGVSLAPTYFSIAIRNSDLRSSCKSNKVMC